MSDPVTNIQIEDVLSSIRRLVAEGERSRTAAPTVPADPPKAEAQPEKFVLTPQFRVVEPEAEAAPAPETAPEPDVEPEGEADEAPMAEDVDGFDAAVAEEEGADEPEPAFAFRPDPPPAAPAPAPVTRPEGRDWSALEATIAELEAAVTRQDDEWEPDGSEEPVAMNWSRPMRSRLHLAPDPEPQAEPAPETAPPPAAEDDDDPFHDDFAPDPVAAATAEADTIADDLSANLDDDGLIDEDTLREMVSEIIRQELQGPLGERITRNVRKLVRREIYRVLASNQMD